MSTMRILVDITHPAHFHFFRHALDEWRTRGHEVIITARHKDITEALLDAHGEAYTLLGGVTDITRKQGAVGLFRELIQRDYALWRFARRVRPDVLCAVGGIFVAHVGAALRIPALVFYDTEHARLQNALTYPLATKVYTPDCYEGWVPASRRETYPGYHELAYVHPNRFTPDPDALQPFGLTPYEPFILMRLVLWQASHDFGDAGVTDVVAMMERLASHGRVLISSERPLPPPLEPYRVAVRPELAHHLLAYARLFIGESATMASEAACLGTPAIFISTSTRGYTNEQERRYGLTFTFSGPERQAEGLRKALEILETPAEAAQWDARRERLLADKADVTAVVVDAVERAGRGHAKARSAPGVK